MAEKVLQTRLQLKYDTLENWSKTTTAGQGANLVLKSGELGICYVPAVTNGTTTTAPTVLFKVGDGSTTYANLPWASALAADVYDWAKASTKPTYAASEITGLQAAIEQYSDYDTDTQYQLVADGANKFKVQSKSLSGSWTDVSGQSIELVQDSTNGHKIGFKINGTAPSTWITIPDTDTTYSNATTSAAGLMSASDKEKLDGISAAIDDAVEASTAELDYTATGMGAGKTIASLTETDGVVAATFQDISITKSQVSDFAHTHDDRYYTETEMDTKLGNKQDSLSFEGTYNATNNKVATKSYVDTAVAGIVDSAPGALDTLNELAAALGDDPNFATTVATQIGGKVDKVEGKGLSTNDLTNALKGNYDVAYTHSQATHARTDATKVEASTTNGNIKINGTETTVYTEVANTVHDASYVHTDNNYTTTEKNKLAGIAANANNYSHPTTTAVTAAAKKVGNDASGHVVLGDALTYSDVGAAASSHTHSQADITQASGDVLVFNCGSSTVNV